MQQTYSLETFKMQPPLQSGCCERALFVGGTKHWQVLDVDISRPACQFPVMPEISIFDVFKFDVKVGIENYVRHWISWREENTDTFYAVYAKTNNQEEVKLATQKLVEETERLWDLGPNRLWLAKSLLDFYELVFIPNLISVALKNKMVIR